MNSLVALGTAAAFGYSLPIQALVDRVTMYFVPAVMVVACFMVLVWLIFRLDLG